MVRGNTITYNYSSGTGGGIEIQHGRPIIRGNDISHNSGGGGGGIFACCSHAVIDSNTFVGNTARGSSGGAIQVYDRRRTAILHNVIRDNLATWGGGIAIRPLCDIPGRLTVADNIIAGNQASVSGGGVYYAPDVYSRDTLSFDHNDVSCNSATTSGGGYFLSGSALWHGYPHLTNESIVFNEAGFAGGVYLNRSTGSLNNCIVWGNDSLQVYVVSDSVPHITYSDIEGVVWDGIGNISADPMFFQMGCPGDYHLQGASPCIDSGDPNPIYNDPDGTTSDMGCYYSDVAGVAADPAPYRGKKLVLFGASPNPFGGPTHVSFAVPTGCQVNLEVIGVTGAVAVAVVNRFLDAGTYRLELDGSKMVSGVYFLRLSTDFDTVSKKIVLIR